MPCPALATADRDRQRNGAVPDRRQPIERRRRPCRARGIEEGAALRGRLQMPLLRRRKRRGQLRHCAQRRIIVAGRRAIRVNEEHRVAKSAALADHHREPAPERGRIGDVAGLHRPFDAAGIGECADRIRRRQPGHQPVEGGRIHVTGARRLIFRDPALGAAPQDEGTSCSGRFRLVVRSRAKAGVSNRSTPRSALRGAIA